MLALSALSLFSLVSYTDYSFLLITSVSCIYLSNALHRNILNFDSSFTFFLFSFK